MSFMLARNSVTNYHDMAGFTDFVSFIFVFVFFVLLAILFGDQVRSRENQTTIFSSRYPCAPRGVSSLSPEGGEVFLRSHTKN